MSAPPFLLLERLATSGGTGFVATFVVTCALLVGLVLAVAFAIARKNAVSAEGAKVSPWSHGIVIVCAVLALVSALPLGCVAYMGPYFAPERYLPGVAQRGNSMVEAIQEYHVETGAWPESLAALVPRHLAVLPGTGFSGRGQWSYAKHEDGWSLSMEINGPFVLDFDEFIYMPDRDPTEGCRRFVRHGAWVYFDD